MSETHHRLRLAVLHVALESISRVASTRKPTDQTLSYIRETASTALRLVDDAAQRERPLDASDIRRVIPFGRKIDEAG